MKYNKKIFHLSSNVLERMVLSITWVTPVMKTSISYLTGEVILSILLNQILSP